MADQPISRPLQQSPDRSTRQSTKGATKRSSKIVERPKAFYITQELDRRLDEAVRYYQEVHGIKKADRSSIVNAMMDNDANWTEEALYLLLDRIISQLTSRLTN